jgi:hypothetical protein
MPGDLASIATSNQQLRHTYYYGWQNAHFLPEFSFPEKEVCAHRARVPESVGDTSLRVS